MRTGRPRREDGRIDYTKLAQGHGKVKRSGAMTSEVDSETDTGKLTGLDSSFGGDDNDESLHDDDSLMVRNFFLI
jgi:hypothetical protein